MVNGQKLIVNKKILILYKMSVYDKIKYVNLYNAFLSFTSR